MCDRPFVLAQATVTKHRRLVAAMTDVYFLWLWTPGHSRLRLLQIRCLVRVLLPEPCCPGLSSHEVTNPIMRAPPSGAP